MLKLNKDGIPLNEMQNALGAQPSLPIVIGSAPDIMDAAAQLQRATNEEKVQTIDEMTLDKMKTKAAEARADRLRAEEVLNQTEQGFAPQREETIQDPMAPQRPQQLNGVDPASLLNGLSTWTKEARQDFFDRLTQDDDFALRLSQAFNSQPQMPQNQQQMMPPWMGQMMPQQLAPQEPQESAASMMTAMIAAVAQLKELSGGNDDGSAAMERMMERMDRMDERQAERDAATQQRMMEIQQSQQNNGVSPQDIQQMIHSTIANSSTDQLAETIKSINGVVGGLQELGVVRRADEAAANNKEDFEQVKWKDKMAFEREGRDREDTKEERDAQIQLAKQENTTGMFKMILDMSKGANETDVVEAKPDDKPLPPAVARAVIS